jgi:hypothetical protein
MVLAGRSTDKLERLNEALGRSATVRVARADVPDALGQALDGAGVVVNCAGPFVDGGLEVARAAIRAGVDYLDVSGEESHVADVYRLDAPAKASGVTISPAFAGKGALGDWGSTVAAGPALRAGGLDEVAVAYAHGLREATRPSMASILAIAGQGVFRRSTDDASLLARSFGFPPPFGRGLALRVPAAETISIPRHLPVRSVTGFISLAPGHPINEPWARLCAAAQPAIPLLARVLFSEWGRFHLRLYLAPPAQAEGTSSFAVSIEVKAGDQSARLAIVAADAYGVTAEVVALGVAALLRGPPLRPGVLTPTEVCDPVAALDHLERTGVIALYRPRASGVMPQG